MLRWEVALRRDAGERERDYLRLSTIARCRDVDYGRALSFWIETVERENRARGISTSIRPRPFLCAVVASDDIAFTR
jgi:hypothetical protein